MSGKKDLARAVLRAHELREASYAPGKMTYDMTVGEACKKASAEIDPDLEPVVYTMVSSAFGEVFDWAEKNK